MVTAYGSTVKSRVWQISKNSIIVAVMIKKRFIMGGYLSNLSAGKERSKREKMKLPLPLRLEISIYPML